MMEEERRKAPRFCEGHIQLCEDIAVIKTTVLALDKRINGSVNAIEKHIDNSRGRNIAVFGSIITIILFLFNLAYALGVNKKQVDINTERWNRLISEQHAE